MGAPFIRFVTPGDVRDLKNRLDPYVRALDAQQTACATLPASTGASWQDFSSKWRIYFDSDDSWLHTAAQMDQGEAYETDIRNWQTLFAKSCTPTTPLPAPTTGTPNEWAPAIPWVAAAVIVGALVYVGAPVVRAWVDSRKPRARRLAA